MYKVLLLAETPNRPGSCLCFLESTYHSLIRCDYETWRLDSIKIFCEIQVFREGLSAK